MTRWTVMAATLLAALSAAGRAHAQRLLMGGEIAVGTGLERSDLLEDRLFRRTRTRIIAGVDGRVDEQRSEGMAILGFAEVEPHISLGGEVRYLRWLNKAIVVFAGGTGVIAPHTLLGVDVGAQIHIPFDKQMSTSLFIEPSFAVLPLGTDLPDDHILLWGLLSVGIHAGF
jgi:hypothetical protein